MSQVEAIEDNRKDEQNTVFLTSQAALVISLLVASVIVFTAKSFTEMSEEEKVIAEQISDSSFKPKEFSHIASADIEIHCPSVKDKSATQVVCDISYFWVESNNSNKFKTRTNSRFKCPQVTMAIPKSTAVAKASHDTNHRSSLPGH